MRFLPKNNAEREISLLKKQLSQKEIVMAEERAEYYNKISESFELKYGTTVADFSTPIILEPIISIPTAMQDFLTKIGR